MTLHGDPGSIFLLFQSGGPGSFLLDHAAVADPRLLETSLIQGFGLTVIGQFDANGDAIVTSDVPTDLGDPFDTVWQAAQTPSLDAPSYTLSNAIVIRFLGARPISPLSAAR